MNVNYFKIIIIRFGVQNVQTLTKIKTIDLILYAVDIPSLSPSPTLNNLPWSSGVGEA